MAPTIITQDAPDDPAVFVYTIPGHTSAVLLAAGCNFDGTGVNAPFIPTLEIDAPNRWQMFLFGQDIVAATHDIVYVTFGVNLQAPTTPTTTGQYFTQTGLTQLELGPGYIISLYLRGLNSSAPAAGGRPDSMVLYLDMKSAGDSFALVNPVLVHKA